MACFPHGGTIETQSLLKANVHSEVNETVKTQDHHNRKKVSKKFADVSGKTHKSPPKP
jgi:hypothetical protein